MPRRFPIFQLPNKSLTLALVARGLSVQLGDEAGRGARNFSNLALLAWAYAEVTAGANWFRRLIGLGGVAYSVGSLVSRW